MLLAGGQGSRLGVLTEKIAKPAVSFGGKYRIIDFPLSNCTNSGIDVVGVLTQYEPFVLNSYIGNGAPWDLNTNNGGAYCHVYDRLFVWSASAGTDDLTRANGIDIRAGVYNSTSTYKARGAAVRCVVEEKDE